MSIKALLLSLTACICVNYLFSIDSSDAGCSYANWYGTLYALDVCYMEKSVDYGTSSYAYVCSEDGSNVTKVNFDDAYCNEISWTYDMTDQFSNFTCDPDTSVYINGSNDCVVGYYAYSGDVWDGFNVSMYVYDTYAGSYDDEDCDEIYTIVNASEYNFTIPESCYNDSQWEFVYNWTTGFDYEYTGMDNCDEDYDYYMFSNGFGFGLMYGFYWEEVNCTNVNISYEYGDCNFGMIYNNSQFNMSNYDFESDYKILYVCDGNGNMYGCEDGYLVEYEYSYDDDYCEGDIEYMTNVSMTETCEYDSGEIDLYMFDECIYYGTTDANSGSSGGNGNGTTGNGTDNGGVSPNTDSSIMYQFNNNNKLFIIVSLFIATVSALW